MDKQKLKDNLTRLLNIEIKSVDDAIKDAKKDVRDNAVAKSNIRDHMLMASSYLKGLERAHSMILLALDASEETIQ